MFQEILAAVCRFPSLINRQRKTNVDNGWQFNFSKPKSESGEDGVGGSTRGIPGLTGAITKGDAGATTTMMPLTGLGPCGPVEGLGVIVRERRKR